MKRLLTLVAVLAVGFGLGLSVPRAVAQGAKPLTPQQRVKISEKIAGRAAELGISPRMTMGLTRVALKLAEEGKPLTKRELDIALAAKAMR